MTVSYTRFDTGATGVQGASTQIGPIASNLTLFPPRVRRTAGSEHIALPLGRGEEHKKYQAAARVPCCGLVYNSHIAASMASANENEDLFWAPRFN
jgi:hypothetical protein